MAAGIDGLPPSARDRIERQRASATTGSLLSAPAAAALRSAGLAPVGEVFGCLAMQLGWTSSACGWYGNGAPAWLGNPSTGWGYSTTSPVRTTGGASGSYAAFGPYVKAFEQGWHGAIDRMLAEAGALDAEGVVGVAVGRSQLDGQAWEFSALGTAVRSTDRSLTGPPGAGGPWHTDLTAEDTAAAILSGLMPLGIAFGISVATKHEDWALKQQRSTWSNTEVDGLTELVTAARADARTRITRRAAATGAGQLVITRMGLSEFETPCGQEVDMHAEAVMVGTVLAPSPSAPFRTRSRPGTAQVLPVMPLSSATDRRSTRRF
jgi:uncharacterized protein YbjQ (UPF0145 family)